VRISGLFAILPVIIPSSLPPFLPPFLSSLPFPSFLPFGVFWGRVTGKIQSDPSRSWKIPDGPRRSQMVPEDPGQILGRSEQAEQASRGFICV